MPNLATSLRAFDIDQLQQIAAIWGLEMAEEDKNSLLLTLELHIPQPELFSAVFDQLPEPARQAIFALKKNDSKLLWSTFVQLYGDIRALGKTLRKKEQPWAFPASISETLWYHGFIGRDFLRVEGDLQEMAYIPDELSQLLPSVPDQPQKVSLAPLSPNVNLEVSLASSTILDEACLLLAALRFENSQNLLAKTTVSLTRWAFLETLLQAVGVLDHEKQPTNLARRFLELPRGQALNWLANQWLISTAFHELFHLPGLQIQTNDPVRSASARQSIVDLLSALQAGNWYSLDDFVELVKTTDPDFLRQQEEYFSWTVLKEETPQEIISGYESWAQVEGALIAFIILRLLQWLALADVGTLKEDNTQSFFRLKPAFFELNEPNATVVDEPEDAQINLTSTGRIIMTDRSPRLARYQIARFADWIQVSPISGTYQITPGSLFRAKEQGLLPKHLITLLRKHADGGLPPVLFEAIKRWESDGTQASLQTQTILRLSSPEILQALRESPAAHWLGESLGPTTVIIKPAGEKAVLSALSSLGYLTDTNESENNNG
jgi:hypothetical protein